MCVFTHTQAHICTHIVTPVLKLSSRMVYLFNHWLLFSLEIINRLKRVFCVCMCVFLKLTNLPWGRKNMSAIYHFAKISKPWWGEHPSIASVSNGNISMDTTHSLSGYWWTQPVHRLSPQHLPKSSLCMLLAMCRLSLQELSCGTKGYRSHWHLWKIKYFPSAHISPFVTHWP